MRAMELEDDDDGTMPPDWGVGGAWSAGAGEDATVSRDAASAAQDAARGPDGAADDDGNISDVSSVLRAARGGADKEQAQSPAQSADDEGVATLPLHDDDDGLGEGWADADIGQSDEEEEVKRPARRRGVANSTARAKGSLPASQLSQEDVDVFHDLFGDEEDGGDGGNGGAGSTAAKPAARGGKRLKQGKRGKKGSTASVARSGARGGRRKGGAAPRKMAKGRDALALSDDSESGGECRAATPDSPDRGSEEESGGEEAEEEEEEDAFDALSDPYVALSEGMAAAVAALMEGQAGAADAVLALDETESDAALAWIGAQAREWSGTLSRWRSVGFERVAGARALGSLPRYCFLHVPSPADRDSWRLPVRDSSGCINVSLVRRAARQLRDGSVGCVIPMDVRQLVDGLEEAVEAAEKERKAAAREEEVEEEARERQRQRERRERARVERHRKRRAERAVEAKRRREEMRGQVGDLMEAVVGTAGRGEGTGEAGGDGGDEDGEDLEGAGGGASEESDEEEAYAKRVREERLHAQRDERARMGLRAIAERRAAMGSGPAAEVEAFLKEQEEEEAATGVNESSLLRQVEEVAAEAQKSARSAMVSGGQGRVGIIGAHAAQGRAARGGDELSDLLARLRDDEEDAEAGAGTVFGGDGEGKGAAEEDEDEDAPVLGRGCVGLACARLPCLCLTPPCAHQLAASRSKRHRGPERNHGQCHWRCRRPRRWR